MSAVVLKGSERRPVPQARAIGKADPAERLEVTLLLRRSGASELAARVKGLATPSAGTAHLSRATFDRDHGASAADIATVKAFAETHGLSVVQEHAGRRTLVLSGTVAQHNTAFGVDLQRYEYAGGSYRGRVGPIHLPQQLDGVVEAVLGLDDRPIARPHFRCPPTGNMRWRGAADGTASFTPPELAALYDFPSGTGAGQCVAIIELGGGERGADLKAYFAELGIASRPKVSVVSVDHAKNHPTGDPNGPDGEVMLDIEVVGAIVPDAHIVVYFAPNTDAGFLDAITTAIHDSANAPSVLSISWGGSESAWTEQAMTAFDSAFQVAATLGITVCVASGDNGSSDGATDGSDHVDFPASSPHVLACGGTTLTASQGSITSETAWNDGASGGASGGGVSSFFALPPWQNGLTVSRTSGGSVNLSGRGVPDVSGDAAPETGYDVRVDGSDAVFGGTSAVAPLWAALLARINAASGANVGFVNPILYASPQALRDVVAGNNGSFAAAAGWDACTGLGTPDGAKVAALFPTSPPQARRPGARKGAESTAIASSD